MIETTTTGVIVAARVIPRAGRAGIAGTRDGALLVRLNAPPVDGAANAELIEVLSKAIGVPKRAVSIVSGDKSRTKRIHVSGVSADTVKRALFRFTNSGDEQT